MALWIKLNAYLRLGVANLFRVFWYLLRLKTGWFRRHLPVGEPINGEFFTSNALTEIGRSENLQGFQLTGQTNVFGWYNMPLDTPPDWHTSVLTGKRLDDNQSHWSDIQDFTSGVGDIKGIWEPSRFMWVLNHVSNYLLTKDDSHIENLNKWIRDWSATNPFNAGANWKCAQEASFRVMHLAAAAILLRQALPEESLFVFIKQHLTRIAPTLGYAKAQDNNHGTSEAAALYIGASWLLQYSPTDKQLQRWQQTGSTYLTERMSRLVMEDGSFSQYSVTYHRVMLDTVCLVELWRRFLDLPKLDERFYARSAKATEWLWLFTDPVSGDAPNLGANDGAHILNYLNTDYRDFRPSVALGCLLFQGKTAFGNEADSRLQALFAVKATGTMAERGRLHKLAEGGYGVAVNPRAWCSFNVPVFRFRPGQEDNLHVDLWVGGLNVLRDAGSFSYNTEQKWLAYFGGVQGHNTIQFDNGQQMPKLSRFLYGCWPQYSHFDGFSTDNECGFDSAFIDFKGNRHQRRITLYDDHLVILDDISGFDQIATIRWRLADAEWELRENGIECDKYRLEIFSEAAFSRVKLEKGYESGYYGRKHAIPVLEVDVKQSAQITTIIHWT